MTSEKPLVSILMPCYNPGAYLMPAVASCLQQSYGHWELLIVDDGSSDGSLETCQSYALDKRIKVYSNEANIGYLKSINKLFEIARGDLITFMDADDLCPQDRIEKQVSFLQMHEEIGVVGTNFQIIDQKGNLIRNCVKPATAEAIDHEKRVENPFCGATMMVRRKVFEKVGGYRSFFSGKSNEDYDWALRLLDVAKGANIQEELYQYRMLPVSDSRNYNNLHKLLSVRLVQELARQRHETGKDWIDKGEEASLLNYEQELKAPYEEDPSLSYREWAAKLMYNKIYGSAVKSALMAVKTRPFMLINWRTWFYCYRKSIFDNK